MWVRGLKLLVVAIQLLQLLSHPMWVRGLKHFLNGSIMLLDNVAPHVGAWIETSDKKHLTAMQYNRTPCGCVD